MTARARGDLCPFQSSARGPAVVISAPRDDRRRYPAQAPLAGGLVGRAAAPQSAVAGRRGDAGGRPSRCDLCPNSKSDRLIGAGRSSSHPPLQVVGVELGRDRPRSPVNTRGGRAPAVSGASAETAGFECSDRSGASGGRLSCSERTSALARQGAVDPRFALASRAHTRRATVRSSHVCGGTVSGRPGGGSASEVNACGSAGSGSPLRRACPSSLRRTYRTAFLTSVGVGR